MRCLCAENKNRFCRVDKRSASAIAGGAGCDVYAGKIDYEFELYYTKNQISGTLMKNLKISLKNCYGIQSLDENFEFLSSQPNGNAYAIYAPNGLMKTSFTKTFEAL